MSLRRLELIRSMSTIKVAHNVVLHEQRESFGVVTPHKLLQI